MLSILQGVSLAGFDNVYVIAAIWVGLACVASLISIRVGLSVALVEILVGVFAGNVFHLAPNDWISFLGWYTTMMMMSTGLTFGSVSALFGLMHGDIDRAQYSVLVTVVVLTALVPTIVAQSFFRPRSHALRYGSESPPELSDEGLSPRLAGEEA